jgi:hypothetical protein
LKNEKFKEYIKKRFSISYGNILTDEPEVAENV